MSNHIPALEISAFGGFTLSLADSTCGRCTSISDSQGRSKKVWALIQYLIFSAKPEVSVTELIDVLWPDDDAEDPIASLRLVIHRARVLLSQLDGVSGNQLILNVGEAYAWNRNVPVQIDANHFEDLCQQAEQCEPAQRVSLLLEAAQVYQGHFIPKSLYMHWAISLDAYYHSRFIAACTKAAQLLVEEHRYQETVDLCSRAVQLEPYSEDLNAALIHALDRVGSSDAALQHYNHISQLLLDDFGISSSAKLFSAYRSISKSSGALETDLHTIRDDLIEDGITGPYRCGYDMFRQFYRLKARENLRSGQAIQLALLTLTAAYSSSPPTQGKRSKATCMEKLDSALSSSLRLGDVYAKFSPSQYILLLQSTDRENGMDVLDRVIANYNNASPRSKFFLQSSILPILPANHSPFFDPVKNPI